MKLIQSKEVQIRGNGLELRIYQTWQSGIIVFHVYNTCNDVDPTSVAVIRTSVHFSSLHAAQNFLELATASFVTGESIDMAKVHGLLELSELLEWIKEENSKVESEDRYYIEVITDNSQYWLDGVNSDYFEDDMALVPVARAPRTSRYRSRYHAECTINRLALALQQGKASDVLGASIAGVKSFTLNVVQLPYRSEVMRVVTSFVVNK